MKQEEKDLFENLYNNAIKDKGYQFLSDKSTTFYCGSKKVKNYDELTLH